MRKILITLTVLLLAAFDIMAQEHLSFKGIPIEGSMADFCQKLEADGFTLIDRNVNAAVLTGDFTGSKATVAVMATDDGKSVFEVLVLFDRSREWNTLVITYDYYKDLYTRKYGKPVFSRESNPAQSDSNIALMAELDQGTVFYASKWKVTGGDIILAITRNGFYEGVVGVRYQDSQKAEARIQEYLGDI